MVRYSAVFLLTQEISDSYLPLLIIIGCSRMTNPRYFYPALSKPREAYGTEVVERSIATIQGQILFPHFMNVFVAP